MPGLDPQSMSLLENPVGKYSARQLRAAGRQFDVIEIFWRDNADEISNQKLDQQFSRSVNLLFYWLPLFRWRTFTQEKSLAYSMFISLFLFLLWFFSTGHTAWTLLPKDVVKQMDDDFYRLFHFRSFFSWLPPTLALWLHSLWHWAKSPLLWAVLSVLVLWLKIPTMITIADFARRYLSDMPNSGASSTLPDANARKPLVRSIHQRLADALATTAGGGYSHITIVAHSMGVLLAVQLLADPKIVGMIPKGMCLRLVTIGGMLPFFSLLTDSAHRDSVKQIACACRKNLNERGSEWEDFYSMADWFSTSQSMKELLSEDRFPSNDIDFHGSLWDNVTGRLHVAYFAHENVRQSILKEPRLLRL